MTLRIDGSPRVRVVVVDDHPLTRDGIKGLLEPHADIEIVAEAVNGQQAVDVVLATRPDVVLMDIQMPELNGIEATEEIRRHWPDARILILTGHRGDYHARLAIRSGALGYLNKSAAAQDLIGAVRAVAMGIRILPDDVARELASTVAEGELTAREIEVLRLVAREGTNKRIATALGVTEDTVKMHVKAILAKLRVADRTTAVIVGIQRGIIELHK